MILNKDYLVLKRGNVDSMKTLLLRVGIDTGTGDGALGPIFEKGTFEYIPIPEEKNLKTKENRTYKDIFGRYGKSLSTYLHERTGNKIIHLDPEFKTFTYGDPTSKRNALIRLKKDDLLVFYVGLTPYKNDEYKKGLYIIGYFTVENVIDFCKLTDEKVEECFRLYSNNAHLKRSYESKKEMREITGEKLGLVIVVGDEKRSELLEKAILISEPGKDKNRKPYQAVSKEMEKKLNIQGSIQRSIPPRWIKGMYIDNLKAILKL